MFLWYWKFSILSFLAFVVLLTVNKSIDSMAEANQIFAYGGAMLIVWMTEAIVNVVNYVRKES